MNNESFPLKFIKLRDAGTLEGNIVFFNVDNIRWFRPEKNGGTYICWGDAGSGYSVADSVDEICDILNSVSV